MKKKMLFFLCAALLLPLGACAAPDAGTQDASSAESGSGNPQGQSGDGSSEYVIPNGSIREIMLTDALKNKTVKEYVTPEMYGAKGDGTTDDSEAFNRMFTNYPGSYYLDGLYFPNPLTVVLGKNKIYKIGHPVTPCNCFELIGNGSMLDSDDVLFNITMENGWNITVSDTIFYFSAPVISTEYKNLERTMLKIDNCMFKGKSSAAKAFVYQRRSSNVIIENSTFSCCRIGDFFDCDFLTLKNNWMEISDLTQDGDYYLSADSNGHNTYTGLEYNTIVPYGNNTGKEIAYVKTNGSISMNNNRFGGEAGSCTILHLTNAYKFKTNGSYTNGVSVVIKDNSDLWCSRGPVVLFDEIPNTFIFDWINGLTHNTPLFQMSEGHSVVTYYGKTNIYFRVHVPEWIFKNSIDRSFYKIMVEDLLPAGVRITDDASDFLRLTDLESIQLPIEIKVTANAVRSGREYTVAEKYLLTVDYGSTSSKPKLVLTKVSGAVSGLTLGFRWGAKDAAVETEHAADGLTAELPDLYFTFGDEYKTSISEMYINGYRVY